MKKEDSLHISGINRNDPELKEKLKRISVSEGVSMSDIVVPLIEDFVSIWQSNGLLRETTVSITDDEIPPLVCQLEHEHDNDYSEGDEFL